MLELNIFIMKKKLLSIIAITLTTFISFSQSVFEVKDLEKTNLVLNGSNIATTTTASSQTAYDFEITNISSVTQTITVRRYDDVLNTVSQSDMALASFCTGTSCFPPSVTSDNIVLAPNAKIALIADIEEASQVGISDIRYRVYDTDNTSDAVTFTLKYNSPVSIKQINNSITHVSDVYPNPSAGKTYLNIVSNQALENANASIMNSLGAIVSVKNIDLSIGKNNIALDTENLSTGLYFAIISNGTQKITKKITITK